MYDYLIGKVVRRDNDFVIYEVGNVGYKIYTNIKENNISKLYIFHYFNDSVRLFYGFKTRIERDIFSKLIEIKSIGHKTAFSILNKYDYRLIVDSCKKKDYDYLFSIYKINKDNVDNLINKLKIFNLNSSIKINGLFYSTLKTFEYDDDLIYKVYKKINKDIDISSQIKEAINILESGKI